MGGLVRPKISAILLLCIITACRCYSINVNNDTDLTELLFPGIGSINSRIVGGQEALVGDFPFQVSIQYRRDHICGGVLLRQNTILTAASCLLSTHKRLLNPELLRVMAGGVETGDYPVYEPENPLFEDKRQYALVSRIYIHSDFNTATKQNNIALLKTQTPLELHSTEEFTFVALANPQTTTVPDGLSCMMSGWGVTGPSATELSEVLKAARVFITNHDACGKIYPGITEDMICAGTTRNEGNAFCDGDIGGGLICNNELVGISSHSSTCGPAPYLVGVYTELRPYLDWIKETQSRTDEGSQFDDRFNSAVTSTICLLLLTIIQTVNFLLLM